MVFTNKIFEKLDNVVLSNDDTDLDDMYSDIAAFFSDGMGLVTIDLNNINLDDDHFDEDDPTNIVLFRLFRISIAWHPTRVWD